MSQEHTTSSGLAEAEADLAARMSGKPPASPADGGQPPAVTPPAEPAPAPVPTPTEPQYPAATPAPEPAPAQPVPPATPVPGVASTPAPAAPEPPATPATGVQDPAARRFLEMHGGDVEKALQAGLNFTNRLGRYSREHPEAFEPGGVADPRQELDLNDIVAFEERPIEAPTLEPVTLDPAMVVTTVNDRVFADSEAMGLIHSYMGNKIKLEGNPQQGVVGLNAQITGLESKVNYESQKLQDPSLTLDDLGKSEITSNVRDLRAELGLLKQERSALQLESRDLDGQFRSYRGAVQDQVIGELTQQAEEEAYTTYEEQMETNEEAMVLREWPGVLQRVITENEIPPEQIEDFSADAAEAYRAALIDDDIVIDNLYGFLSKVGKDKAARLDRYHRIRAGQYGTAAAARSATPSPPTGPGTPAPPATPPKTPEEAMADATHYLRQRLRAGG